MIWPTPDKLESISDHQRERCVTALSGPIGILGGGPGTGKTYTAASVLRAIVEEHGVAAVAVAAPTGKAAVRITEAMQTSGLPLTATTIHRLLGVQRNGRDGGGWSFRFCESDPLRKRFVVIDEASMLDTDLAASLFAACGPGTHVLLVGDLGQLPPVSHGAPLRDFVRAGLSHGELCEVQRNSGDIVRACHAIRGGGRYQPSETIDVEAGHNLRHIESVGASQTRKQIERLLGSTPVGIDATWDCQVVVVVNGKSDLSREALNVMLQRLLNPCGEACKANDFRTNDKVICLSNSMLPLADDEDVKEFVANGEIGRVLHVEPKMAVVVFDSPDRTIEVRGEYLSDLALAYAITVHKSQGAEWPVAIYVSDDYRGARFVSCRELIYTAISRARKLCVTIGRQATIDADCRRVVLDGRKTFLRGRLAAESAGGK